MTDNADRKIDADRKVTHGRFLAGGTAFAVAAAVAGRELIGRGRAEALEAPGFFEPDSTFFATAFTEYSDSLDTIGDLCPLI